MDALTKITFLCHYCRESISALASAAGKPFKCPKCGERIIVPVVPEESAEPFEQPYRPPALQQVVVVGIKLTLGDSINLIVTLAIAAFVASLIAGALLLFFGTALSAAQ